MPDIQLGLNNQETIDAVNAAHKFLNRNNTNVANRIVVTDSNGKLISSGASVDYIPMQHVNSDSSPVFFDATIGGHLIDSELDTLNARVTQPVTPTSDVLFNTINRVGITTSEHAGPIIITAKGHSLTIDENKLLSDKADKTLVAAHPDSVDADLKIDYITGDLDTAEKIASAINATNGRINQLITALKEVI